MNLSAFLSLWKANYLEHQYQIFPANTDHSKSQLFGTLSTQLISPSRADMTIPPNSASSRSTWCTLSTKEIRTSSYMRVSRIYLAKRYYSLSRMATRASPSRENSLTSAAPAWKASSELKGMARRWIDTPMANWRTPPL